MQSYPDFIVQLFVFINNFLNVILNQREGRKMNVNYDLLMRVKKNEKVKVRKRLQQRKKKSRFLLQLFFHVQHDFS